ncbi:MAG: hypothetical protein IJV31_04985 [Clostridia bacterium]|nr:hypothetical protein [Clostridia bacterium]
MGVFDKFKKEDNFPYVDGKDKATYTCRNIMNKQDKIADANIARNGQLRSDFSGIKLHR